jgi:hypothetical protein
MSDCGYRCTSGTKLYLFFFYTNLGMDCLKYIYINISLKISEAIETLSKIKLEKLKAKTIELKKKLDDINKKSPTEKELEQLEACNQNEYENLKNELYTDNNYDEIKQLVLKDKDCLIHKQIVAPHLNQYVERSLERWIEGAFTAKYQLEENVEYKIVKKDDENVIIPVDNQNTGVSMNNTVLINLKMYSLIYIFVIFIKINLKQIKKILSNGLHQFLQLKHNLCLTYESLTSCFVSNIGYVKKYGNKVTGVTGTLGSEAERSLLGAVFQLNFSIIPTYKQKKFKKFPIKVVEDSEFTNTVAMAILGETIRKENNIQKPRAILVICTSIKEVYEIEQSLIKNAKQAGLTPNIKKYTDETEARITRIVVKPNDVILATNISGRGTDLKTSDELELNGGLHVIKAFLACNQRVEDQAMGRTSRQGK